MTVRAWFVACASVVVLFGTGAPAHAQIEELTPVTDAVLQDPDPADWLSWRRTLDGWGYSPLDEIDRGNVGELRLAWSWGMEPGVSQTTPMVHDGILYLANPGNVVQAIGRRQRRLHLGVPARDGGGPAARRPRCAASPSTRTSSS